MDAADDRLVAGVVEWLFGYVAGCQALTGRSEIVVDPAGHLAVCCRADCRDAVVDGMPWRTAGKSVRYAGELVVPEPLDAFRRQLSF